MQDHNSGLSKLPRGTGGGASRCFADWTELAKARLSSLVLATTAGGYWMAAPRDFHWGSFAAAMLGTALAAFGANMINQWMERREDGLMQRTCDRPLPTGRVRPALALSVAIALVGLSAVILALLVNGLTAAIGLFVVALYVFVYTPMKKWTPLNTLVGAICGALPPVMGWTAATGGAGPGAWVLAAILFIWQIPHFLALAWLYREDYARGGFRMLPVVEPAGEATRKMILLYSLALIPIALAMTLIGAAGPVYALASLPLGVGFVALGYGFHRNRTREGARRVFLASIAYLPLLLLLMAADREPERRGTPAGMDNVALVAASPSISGSPSIGSTE